MPKYASSACNILLWFKWCFAANPANCSCLTLDSSPAATLCSISLPSSKSLNISSNIAGNYRYRSQWFYSVSDSCLNCGRYYHRRCHLRSGRGTSDEPYRRFLVKALWFLPYFFSNLFVLTFRYLQDSIKPERRNQLDAISVCSNARNVSLSSEIVKRPVIYSIFWNRNKLHFHS